MRFVRNLHLEAAFLCLSGLQAFSGKSFHASERSGFIRLIQVRFSGANFEQVERDKSLTADLEESQVKNRVKNGGSFPSVTMYIGVSLARFSRRKSCLRNFC